MPRLTLVRHASTRSVEEARYPGEPGGGLSPDGIREARALAASLAGREVDEVWCSDLPRAVETARIVFPRARVRLEPRLRELRFGAFGERSHAENLARFGERYAAWVADPRARRPPGGETLAELEARLRAWLGGLRRPAVAVTHGGPIRALAARARGVPFESLPPADFPPGAVVEIEPDGTRP